MGCIKIYFDATHCNFIEKMILGSDIKYFLLIYSIIFNTNNLMNIIIMYILIFYNFMWYNVYNSKILYDIITLKGIIYLHNYKYRL